MELENQLPSAGDVNSFFYKGRHVVRLKDFPQGRGCCQYISPVLKIIIPVFLHIIKVGNACNPYFFRPDSFPGEKLPVSFRSNAEILVYIRQSCCRSIGNIARKKRENLYQVISPAFRVCYPFLHKHHFSIEYVVLDIYVCACNDKVIFTANALVVQRKSSVFYEFLGILKVLLP